MISVNDLKTGLTIEFDGNIFRVIEFQHVKPGKGAAFVRTKLKNLRNGNTAEKTFRGGEKVAKAQIDNKKMQYLYESAGNHVFMDLNTYEQIELPGDVIEDELKYLLENSECNIIMYGSETLGVDLPNSVDLEVIECDPGVRGDTATGATKMAKLETGYSVRVPLFINQGDVLRIDTRTGNYMERA